MGTCAILGLSLLLGTSPDLRREMLSDMLLTSPALWSSLADLDDGMVLGDPTTGYGQTLRTFCFEAQMIQGSSTCIITSLFDVRARPSVILDIRGHSLPWDNCADG